MSALTPFAPRRAGLTALVCLTLASLFLAAGARPARAVSADQMTEAAPDAALPAATEAAATTPAKRRAKAARQAAKDAEAGIMTLDQFLDRLMIAESGGHAFAKNPRSTATGPFQFIASTWLQLVRESFAAEVAKLKPNEILDLRTEPAFARRVARQYTQNNANYLAAAGHKPTFANLRLAFLVGPGGAVQVLSAKPETLVSDLLGSTVIGANPFMAKMSAEALVARAARDIAAQPSSVAGLPADGRPVAVQGAKTGAAKSAKRAKAAAPKIAVSCDLSRPSCRRWLALATKRASNMRRASRD